MEVGSFNGCDTPESVVEEMLKYQLAPYHDVCEEIEIFLVDLMLRHMAETQEYVEAIKARPYRAVNVQRTLLAHLNGGKSRQ